MDNNVGNEEEKVPVESSGATNKPSKKQVYLVICVLVWESHLR